MSEVENIVDPLLDSQLVEYFELKENKGNCLVRSNLGFELAGIPPNMVDMIRVLNHKSCKYK